MSIFRRMKIDPYLCPCTKLKVKWTKYLNINPTMLNLTEEKMGSILQCMGPKDYFLNITSIAQTLRAAINKWDLVELRNFCKANDIVNKTKRQSTEW